MDNFFIHYMADGQIDFLSRSERNDSYTVAFIGEGFGLVDENGQEYDTGYVGSALDFLNLISLHDLDVIHDINGAFLSAVYDCKEKVLRIENDRFGLLPAYVLPDGEGGWYITSQIQNLCGLVEINPDYVGIAEYLTFDYCLEDRTFFNGVKYMVPAEKITISADGIKREIYYRLPKTFGEKVKSKDEYMDEFDELYRHAIEIRKAEDNIIGLTGGFDSRLILGILGGEKCHTYNFGNKGSGDEVGATALADAFDTDHHYLDFTGVDIVSDAREIIRLGDGQCPWERFYALNAAKDKSKVMGGVEVSGMGGDAISGQKSNFTGLIPNMGRKMNDAAYTHEGRRLISDISRGRLAAYDLKHYGKRLAYCWDEVRTEFGKATKEAEVGDTFGNYTMRLKLRTLERRVTMSSMWITAHYLPIRFPIYDYAVMAFFNRLPQKYRYGQKLYIETIAKKYKKAASAPHSETGQCVNTGHILRTDFVTVRNYAMKKLFGISPAYTNSFGFVNQKIRECENIKDLISDQRPSKDGIFNITEYGNVDNLINIAMTKGGTAMTMLKNIIQISLVNEIFFDNKIEMYYLES